MANGNGATASSAAGPAVGPGDVPRDAPPQTGTPPIQYTYRNIRGNRVQIPLTGPQGLGSEAAVDKWISSKEFDQVYHSLPDNSMPQREVAPGSPAGTTPGETVRPGAGAGAPAGGAGAAAGPPAQLEGPLREPGIAVGHLVRGVMEPLALPGDIGYGVNSALGGALSASPTSVWGRMPTSMDLDRIATGIGLTPPSLTPQTPGERILAAGSEGVGQAADELALGGVLGIGSRAAGYPLNTFGRPIRTLAAGGAGGAAAEGVTQIPVWRSGDSSQGPGLQAVAPVAAGALVGGAVGGPVSDLVSYMRPARFGGGNQYNNVLQAHGIDSNYFTNPSTRQEAGQSVQDAVTGDPARAIFNMTDDQRAAVIGKTAAGTGRGQPPKPGTVYNAIIGDPRLASNLRAAFPDALDDVSGRVLYDSHSKSAVWNALHPQTRTALIPNAVERGILNNRYGASPAGGTGVGELLAGTGVMGLGHSIWEGAYGLGEMMAPEYRSIAGGIMMAGAAGPILHSAMQQLRRFHVTPGQMGTGAYASERPAVEMSLPDVNVTAPAPGPQAPAGPQAPVAQ